MDQFLMASSNTVIEIDQLGFHYPKQTDNVIEVERFEVQKSQHCFIHGPSGCGKSTLLGLMTGILSASSGSIKVLGRDFAKMSLIERDRYRGLHIGYIFQMFNLIPFLSVRDNLLLPSKFFGAKHKMSQQETAEKIDQLASRLSIKDSLDKKPWQMSIGQQQRVAAARALLSAPELIIADEPTSSLDHANRDEFIELLFDEAKKSGSTIVFVSHDMTLSSHFDHKISFMDVNKA